MKEKKEYIYCVFCGEKNEKSEKFCKKCKESLSPKNHLLRDYTVEHFQDDLKENVEDSVFAFIKAWIISHLYGITMLVAVIFTGSLIILRNNSITSIRNKLAPIKEVDAPFVLKEKCEKKELIEKVKFCQEGYNLEDDKCTKYTYQNTKSKTECPKGYYLSGNRCLSNNKVDLVSEKSCSNEVPNGFVEAEIVTRKMNDGKCYAVICIHNYTVGNYNGVISGNNNFTVVTPSNENCDSTRDVEISTVTNTKCPAFTTSNGECRNTKNPTTTKYCEKGNLKNNKCEIVETTEYELKCPEGYFYNEHCNMCEKEA